MLGAVEPAETKLRQDELLREIHALRQREANLRDFVETATIGLHWVSGEGNILWANQAETRSSWLLQRRIHRTPNRRIPCR